MKIIFYIPIILLGLCIAAIPEIGMYNAWQLIQPDSALAKIALVALFWFAGIGLCAGFAYIGLMVAGLLAEKVRRW